MITLFDLFRVKRGSKATISIYQYCYLPIPRLAQAYEKAITCISFMGGDADTGGLYRLADFVRKSRRGKIKTAWYSGNNRLPENAKDYFDFVKTGPL